MTEYRTYNRDNKGVQSSCAFIYPYLENKIDNFIDKYLINTYMGNYEYQGDIETNKLFYMHVKDIDKDNYVRDVLKANPNYLDHYEVDEKSTMYIFTYPEIVKLSVVDPFVQGKYSRIADWYRDKYIARYESGTMRETINYRVLTKHPSLQKYWTERIGVEESMIEEVWPIINPAEEIFKYEDYLIANELKSISDDQR